MFPAVTTQFRADQSLDVEATMAHVERLISAGCHGLIMLGTVGENVQLEPEEKRKVVAASVKAAGGRVPVLSGVAETSTALACRYAQDCRKLGLDGLMVLPAMVYKSDARETIAHFRAVARAGELPVMIYNNPVSYGVDVTPPMLEELSDEPMLVVKSVMNCPLSRPLIWIACTLLVPRSHVPLPTTGSTLLVRITWSSVTTRSTS